MTKVKHICQIKRDNGVLYLRIPIAIVKAEKIEAKDYYVMTCDRSGTMQYKPLKREIGG